MRRGLTLIEVLITIVLVAILGGFVIVSLNPVGQLASARNNQRLSNLNTILNSISQNAADNKGNFTCSAGAIPSTSTKRMAIGAGNYDIASCLIPIYTSVLPFDPKDPLAHFTSQTDYDTGYTITRNASSGAVTMSAPSGEYGKVISVSR